MTYRDRGKHLHGYGGRQNIRLSGMHASRNRGAGFTLLELLISLAIGLVILGGMYSVFTIQNRHFSHQEQITEMRQIARIAMDVMVREITMAGYNPNCSTPAADAGITAAAATSLTCKADLDGNGVTTGTNESITYALDSDDYRITRHTGGGAQPFAENIQDLTFTYYDANGNVTATLANIRRIKISITARTAKPDPDYGTNSGYRTYTLTSYVTPRNLALSCSAATTSGTTTMATMTTTTRANTLKLRAGYALLAHPALLTSKKENTV